MLRWTNWLSRHPFTVKITGSSPVRSTHKFNIMLEQLLEYFEEEEFLKADGFDEAVIGVDEKSMRLIYSVTKCLEILVTDEDMSVEEAIEYFDFNVRGAYVGDKTPIWCEDGFM
jgi:hypothetical protein